MTVIILAFLVNFAVAWSKKLENADCKPRPTVVAVDAKHHRFFPHYVLLHRCGGSWPQHSPNDRKCTSAKHDEIKLSVRSMSDKTPTYAYVQNDTKCVAKCVASPMDCNHRWQTWNGDSCRCDCNYGPAGPPGECPQGFKWSTIHCKCLCNKEKQNCSHKKVWDTEKCACTCKNRVIKRCARREKQVNYKTCTCEDSLALIGKQQEESGTNHLFIVLLAVQSCVIVILVVALFYWIRKKRQPKVPPYYCEAPVEGSVDTMSSAAQDDRANKVGSWTLNDEIVLEEKAAPPQSV